VAEYLIDLNATQAAIRAGYSEKTAQAIGAENLTKPLIAEAISEAQETRHKRLTVTADSLVMELEEARANAIASNQNSAAVAATMGKAKLLGIGSDKVELTGKDGGAIQTSVVVEFVSGKDTAT
jgi:phage terminase small subunit